ncbi:MAG: succinate--CoA ligase subunit alpha [Armatimonadetes bacterium]|nr:succinate--CoA ligase subunit alpha [Armatimonadota bacterium]
MSIIVDKNTRLLVQGITGREGGFHTQQMLAYGTRVVGGVTPGKGGEQAFGLPVFNTVKEAVRETRADATVIFVPAPFAADAVSEAAQAGIRTIICITEGVPVQDMLAARAEVLELGARLIGPNCPGIITPGECKIGIMPGHIFAPGKVGLISRSGTLTYQVVDQLTRAGLGQSTCVGIGGDPVIGTYFVDALKLFHQDPDTQAVVIIGEIGGSAEEEAAEYLSGVDLPSVVMIAGRTAPPGKRMGHAGAIVSGSSGTAQAKVDAFKALGIPVPETTSELVEEMKKILQGAPA